MSSDRTVLDMAALDEERPGPILRECVEQRWVAYQRWYFGMRGREPRPTYLECRRALTHHFPELVPLWEEITRLVGGTDAQARFLSLYRPPPYRVGCSQAFWNRDGDPLLVRNYDYDPGLFDAVVLRSRWRDRTVVAVTDCMIGALDGINEHGLCVSLSFGGSLGHGDGFGAPFVVRALLELCRSTREAMDRLANVRTHMAYSLLVCDAGGHHVTAFLRPEIPTTFHEVSISTNHQHAVEWEAHAAATGSLERERCLHERLADPSTSRDRFVESFLEPPVLSDKHDRGRGTLYTAVYDPRVLGATYRWPGTTWNLGVHGFTTREERIPL